MEAGEQTARAARQEPRNEALADVHGRLAAELEALRCVCMRIEQSLCSAMDSWSVGDGRVQDLQQLDFLMQHLAALRDFLGALGGLSGASVRVDVGAAYEQIRLGDLKARLGGAAAQRRATTHEAKDLELF